MPIQQHEVCLKSNETGAINFFINNWTTINIIPFPWEAPPLQTLLPLPVAVLEVFMWKCPQLDCHNILDVVHSSKILPVRWNLSFGKGRSHKDSDKASIGAAERLEYRFLSKFLQRDCSVTGNVVRIQVSAISGRTRWTLFLTRTRNSR